MAIALDGKQWRSQLYHEWGIRTLDSFASRLRTALWTTRCSKTKNVPLGTPDQLYVSASNRFFYKFVQAENLRFGVISDQYGIHFDDENLPYYDVHPGQLSEADKRALGEVVRKKITARGYAELVFYNASPLMSVPYFEILSFSRLPVYYTTRLRDAWG